MNYRTLSPRESSEKGDSREEKSDFRSSLLLTKPTNQHPPKLQQNFSILRFKMSLASIQIRNSIFRSSQSNRIAVRCFNSNQFSTKFQSCIPSTSTSALTSSSNISKARHLSTSAISRNAHSAPQDEGEKKIYNLLNESFSPKELKVQDVSGE